MLGEPFLRKTVRQNVSVAKSDPARLSRAEREYPMSPWGEVDGAWHDHVG